MPGALPTKFKVIAYNLDSKPLAATMTGWGVDAWSLEVTQSVRRVLGGCRRCGREHPPRRVRKEHAGSIFTFAPHVTTELNLELETPVSPCGIVRTLGSVPTMYMSQKVRSA